MNNIQLENAYTYRDTAQVKREKQDATSANKEQSTSKATADRFERGVQVDNSYAKISSSQRFVAAELDKIRNVNIESAGIPSPVLLKSTLETVERQLENGEKTLVADPQVLVTLLKGLMQN